jgi:predicted HicB family RNase H-like nuclease
MTLGANDILHSVHLGESFHAEPGRVNSMPETVVHFQIRMSPALHERLASWAREEKNSLNALIVSLLNQAAAGRDAETTRAAG